MQRTKLVESAGQDQGKGRGVAGFRQPLRGHGTKGTCLACTMTSATCPAQIPSAAAGLSPWQRSQLTGLLVGAGATCPYPVSRTGGQWHGQCPISLRWPALPCLRGRPNRLSTCPLVLPTIYPIWFYGFSTGSQSVLDHCRVLPQKH